MPEGKDSILLDKETPPSLWQEGVGPKGIRPNHTETRPNFFGSTALKMDRQKNTGLKLDKKNIFRFNFSFKKRKEAEMFLLSLGRNIFNNGRSSGRAVF